MEILRIGVTGSAGSGKSVVCQGFKALGLVTLDCDQIARQVVEPGQKAYGEVVACFGSKVVKADGSLDRVKMRNLIVDQPKLRKELENLLHPRILEEMDRQMETAVYGREQACAVEVPLLFELNMEKKFDVTIAVVTEENSLVERISQRDGVSLESAQKMLMLQMSQSEKMKRAHHVIKNQGTPGELFESVEKIYTQIKKEFLTRNA